MRVSFVIPTHPTGKGRPRLCSSGSVFTPSRTKYYENFIKGCYIEQCGDVSFGDKSIVLYIKAYSEPLSKFKKEERKNALLNLIKPTSKPDVDNILKAILDALNEVAYNDDRYIYKIVVERYYSDEPRTEVEITDEE